MREGGGGGSDHVIFYTLKLALHSAVDHEMFAKKESQLSLRSEYHNCHLWDWPLQHVTEIVAAYLSIICCRCPTKENSTKDMAELSPYKLFPE